MRDSGDVIDQLRRYGDAVERAARTDARSRRRVPVRLLAVAAAVFAVVVGGAALVALGDDDGDATRITTAGPDDTTATPTTTGSTATTTTAAVAGSTTPGTLVGTAVWLGGGDPRATLRVGACPVDDTAQGCPAFRSTSVSPDGSFTLVLPPVTGSWRVAAYVTADRSGCVFDCVWAGAQVGETTTLSVVDVPTPALDLEVSARVVDVHVRDRNGNVFAGGGVQATAVDADAAPMFAIAADGGGPARLVVDPNVTYDVHGQARDMGWPDPQWTNDGSEFWFSPDETFAGADIPDGHVVRVDGAPGQ